MSIVAVVVCLAYRSVHGYRTFSALLYETRCSIVHTSAVPTASSTFVRATSHKASERAAASGQPSIFLLPPDQRRGRHVPYTTTIMPAATKRCMRFTVGALACNAACLGFATGLGKAPSHALSNKKPHKASSIIMRGGPVRGGVEPGAEPGWARRQRKDAWTTRGRHFLSVLRSGKQQQQQQGGVGGEKTAVGALSAADDNAQVRCACSV